MYLSSMDFAVVLLFFNLYYFSTILYHLCSAKQTSRYTQLQPTKTPHTNDQYKSLWLSSDLRDGLLNIQLYMSPTHILKITIRMRICYYSHMQISSIRMRISNNYESDSRNCYTKNRHPQNGSPGPYIS